jgi:hypothetical protein
VCVCVCVGGWTGREASFSPADYEYFLTTWTPISSVTTVLRAGFETFDPCYCVS